MEELLSSCKRENLVEFLVLLSANMVEKNQTLMPICDSCQGKVMKETAKQLNEAIEARDQTSHSLSLLQIQLQQQSKSSLPPRHPGTSPSSLDKARERSIAPASPSATLSQLRNSLKEKQTAIKELEDSLEELSLLETKVECLSINSQQEEGQAAYLLDLGTRLYSSKYMETVFLRNTLSLLQHTSSLDDVFFIWHSGPYGTINQCRLGKLPIPSNYGANAGFSNSIKSPAVDWPEINAAFGYTALCVSILAKRIPSLSLKQFRIIPMGSYSRLMPLQAGASVSTSLGFLQDSKNSIELFNDGKLFAPRRLNAGICAFLSCIAEMATHITSVLDSSFTLPHPISSDGRKIGQEPTVLSTEYGKSEILWTRAMKLLLIDVKWMLAWTHRLQGVN
jgi:beclin